jgi:hypothetical protein
VGDDAEGSRFRLHFEGARFRNTAAAGASAQTVSEGEVTIVGEAGGLIQADARHTGGAYKGSTRYQLWELTDDGATLRICEGAQRRPDRIFVPQVGSGFAMAEYRRLDE